MSVQRALILTSIDLNIFTDCLSKTSVQLCSKACKTENKDLNAIWMKPWEFVAYGGR